MKPGSGNVERVVLAYSGGLDTSIILHWLRETYDCDVITFTADLGQQDEIESAMRKALEMGVPEAQIHTEDLREDFVANYVFPMFRANAVYEGEYLLGTSISRPLIAKRLVEIAREEDAQAISHGATGKGNDQVRFELSAYSLAPDIKIIAPWREWDLNSRRSLIAYAEQHDISIDAPHGPNSPFSTDANLLHISYEGGILEDPWAEPPDNMWQMTARPDVAPDLPEYLEITYKKGDIVALNQAAMTPAAALNELNLIGGRHGVGRIDIVENRYVGIKSRGAYETPGGSMMLKAHRAIESITLDREVAHLKDSLMPRYAETVYNGYWWSPERLMLQNAIDHSQAFVNGEVRLKLHKGSVDVVGRRSDDSLFDRDIATFESDGGVYDQSDAEGFIKLNALRLRNLSRKRS